MFISFASIALLSTSSFPPAQPVPRIFEADRAGGVNLVRLLCRVQWQKAIRAVNPIIRTVYVLQIHKKCPFLRKVILTFKIE